MRRRGSRTQGLIRAAVTAAIAVIVIIIIGGDVICIIIIIAIIIRCSSRISRGYCSSRCASL